MGSNSVEIQNAQVYLKHTTCNTLPFICASCGSNEYFQTFCPVNCLYPCIKKLKETSDFHGDEFSTRQPLLSSPPLLQPLFQSDLISANVFHAKSDSKTKSEILKEEPRGRNEEDINKKPVHPQHNIIIHEPKNLQNKFYHFLLSDKMTPKPHFQNNNSSNTENSKKSESEISDVQPCACGSDIPWIYSPIIVPIIPYYLIWNPKFSNTKPQSVENEKALETKKTCSSLEKSVLIESKSQNSFSNKNKDVLPKDDKDLQEKCLLDNKMTQGQWIPKSSKHDSSSSLFSLSSLDCCEDGIFFCGNKKIISTKNIPNDTPNAKNITFDFNNSENFSINDIVTKESEPQANTNEQKTNSHPVVQSDFCLPSLSHESDLEKDNIKNNASQPLLTSQIIFKAEYPDKNKLTPEFTDVESEEISFTPVKKVSTDILSSRKLIKEKKSESGGETKLEDTINIKPEDKTASKRSYKNFTMSDLSECKNREKVQIFDAAAGDLGSGNCSYKVVLTPSNEHIEENSWKGIPEIFSQKGQDSKIQTISVSNENQISVTDKTQKVKEQKNLKSGIAKLTNNFKTKESKPNQSVENKELKSIDSKSKGQCINKRKFNTNQTVNTAEKIENNSRIQKIKKDIKVTPNLTQGEENYGLVNQTTESKAFQEKEKLFNKYDKKKLTKIKLPNSK